MFNFRENKSAKVCRHNFLRQRICYSSCMLKFCFPLSLGVMMKFEFSTLNAKKIHFLFLWCQEHEIFPMHDKYDYKIYINIDILTQFSSRNLKSGYRLFSISIFLPFFQIIRHYRPVTLNSLSDLKTPISYVKSMMLKCTIFISHCTRFYFITYYHHFGVLGLLI